MKKRLTIVPNTYGKSSSAIREIFRMNSRKAARNNELFSNDSNSPLSTDPTITRRTINADFFIPCDTSIGSRSVISSAALNSNIENNNVISVSFLRKFILILIFALENRSKIVLNNDNYAYRCGESKVLSNLSITVSKSCLKMKDFQVINRCGYLKINYYSISSILDEYPDPFDALI